MDSKLRVTMNIMNMLKSIVGGPSKLLPGYIYIYMYTYIPYSTVISYMTIVDDSRRKKHRKTDHNHGTLFWRGEGKPTRPVRRRNTF